MSYAAASEPIYAATSQPNYSSTPPAPPPKPSYSATPGQGPPPLPPLPPGQTQTEPSELDGVQVHPYQQQAHAPSPNIPAIESNWLPEIVKDKTTADLYNLLNDSALQNALLSNPMTTHPAVPASEQALTPLLESNIALASSLTALESQLSQERSAVQARLLALRALEQQHRSKISGTEQALEKFSPMALYARLSASVSEQEHLVRGMEESWLEESGEASEREVADFVRRVKEARKVGFLRQERKGRWDEGRVGGWR